MTIIPRGGRYGVRVSIDGERRWVGTFGTHRKARRAEAAALLASPEPDEPPTCGEYVDWYLEGYRERTKNSSYLSAKAKLGAFSKAFGKRPLDSISPLEAERWARANRSAVEPVVTLFNDAHRKQLVALNPFRGQVRRGEGRRHYVPLTEAQVGELACCAEDTLAGYGHEFAALVRFAAYTGLRAGELFALEWRDIDIEARRVRVRRRVYAGSIDVPKTGKPDRALAPQARDAILALDRGRDTVFAGKRGQRLSMGVVSWYWPAVWGRFGQRVTLHDLRHFCGHHLYVTLALPSRVVAAQLGHSSPRLVEQLYGHGDVGALEELDEAFSRTPAPVRGLRVAEKVAEGA